MNRFIADLVTFALIVRSWRDIWRFGTSVHFHSFCRSSKPWDIGLMRSIKEMPVFTPMTFTVTTTPVRWEAGTL